MYTALIILYAIIFLYLCYKNIKWAVLLVIFTLPVYQIRFQLAGLPLTLLEAEILILFIIFLIQKSGRILKVKQWSNEVIQKKWFHCFIVSLFLFLLASTLSVFVSPNLRVAAGLWKAYFIEPILFLIVFVSIIKKQDIKDIFKILTIQVLLLALFAIYQKFTGAFISNDFWAAGATRRVTSVFGYPNALALYLAPIIILLIGWLTRRIWNLEFGIWNFFVSCFLFLVTCAAIAAVYFTKSKGALLAILAGIIFYAIFYKNKRKIFFSILIIAILLSCYLVFSGNLNLKGSATVEGGDSISTRFEMWSETFSMLKNKPLLGAGLAGYQQSVARYHTKDYIEIYLYPHNIILNFWTEIGLLGLIAFILIIIWFYRIGFKFVETRRGASLQEINVILMAAMIALLTHGLVDVPYFKNDLAVLFWVIVGMMIISTNYKSDTNIQI